MERETARSLMMMMMIVPLLLLLLVFVCFLVASCKYLVMPPVLYFSVRGAGLVIPQTAMSCFPGFLPAIEACCLDWKNVNLGIVPEEKVLQVSQPLTLPCARICQPEATKDEESKHDETTPVVR